MSKVFSVRLGDDLGARVVEIAQARGVKAPTILKAAVESYVDDFARGLPDASAPPVQEPAPSPRREQARRVLVAASSLNERQARLNAAKYGGRS